jgi:hypothetical protein
VTVASTSTTLIADQANRDEIKARIAQIKKELAETDSGGWGRRGRGTTGRGAGWGKEAGATETDSGGWGSRGGEGPRKGG